MALKQGSISIDTENIFPIIHRLNKIPAYIPNGRKINTFIIISLKSILPFWLKSSLNGIKFTLLLFPCKKNVHLI